MRALALGLVLLCGCLHLTSSAPDDGATPDGGTPPTPPDYGDGCLVDGPATLPDPSTLHETFPAHAFRVNRTTGASTPLVGNVAPIGGAVSAEVDPDGMLLVRRGGQLILATDARGAYSTDAVERDGVLYLTLNRLSGERLFQALRLDAAPSVSTIWCRSMSEYGANSHWVYATANGPLLLTSASELRAIDAETGALRWRTPWKHGAPFTLLESGNAWVACERDVVAFDRLTGTELWRHAAASNIATDCDIVGERVVFAARQCDNADCTPKESGALAIADGAQLWSVQGVLLDVLVERDADHALVAVSGGIAVLDTRTGARGATLALATLAPPWRGELLPDGDAILHGQETMRVGGTPLALRWQAPYHGAVRSGSTLLATRVEEATSSAWLVSIDVATGAVRESLVEKRATPSEWGEAEILAVTADAVDVVTRFGFLLF